MKGPITESRAERIAKAHACGKCGEYSYKRVAVHKATKDRQQELGVAWIAEKRCGVCDTEQEIGIAADGRIVYEN